MNGQTSTDGSYQYWDRIRALNSWLTFYSTPAGFWGGCGVGLYQQMKVALGNHNHYSSHWTGIYLYPNENETATPYAYRDDASDWGWYYPN
jgi:hypothetical protein